MYFVRLDCLIRQHPKMTSLKSSTCWYFICCLGYANQHHTGGYLPLTALAALWRSSREPRFQYRVHVALLCRAGLLDPVGDAMRIHDYFDYQPTLESVEQKRTQDRVRQQRRRDRLRADKAAAVAWFGPRGAPADSASTRNQAPAGGVDESAMHFQQRSRTTFRETTWVKVAQHVDQEVRSDAISTPDWQLRHGVTGGRVTHQQESQNFEIRSYEGGSPFNSRMVADRSDSGAVEVADLVRAFSVQAGWGQLPQRLVDDYLGLSPPPTWEELAATHAQMMRQQASRGTPIRSCARYALSCLENGRRRVGRSSVTQTAPTKPRVGRETRAEQLDLLAALEEALAGSCWAGSLTTGVIERLWEKRAQDTGTVLAAVAEVEASGATQPGTSSWTAVCAALDKGRC